MQAGWTVVGQKLGSSDRMDSSDAVSDPQVIRRLGKNGRLGWPYDKVSVQTK
jgi:hypothetical protein